MKVIVLALIATLVIGSTALAQDLKTAPKRPSDQPTENSPPLPTGRTFSGQVFVGERAPDFVIDDAFGRLSKLSQFRTTWVVLVFADRGRDIAHLRMIDDEITELGARMVAVCHEKSTALRTLAQRDSVHFVLLADVTGEVAARYGLYDQILRRTTPGFFVLDKSGVVRLAVLGRGLPAQTVMTFARFAVTGL